MRKLVTAALTAALLAGGAGTALANGPSAGPGSPALFGLCTAWQASETGRENGNPEDAPPFQNLQKAAKDAGYDTVEQYCADHGQRPGGGNRP